eukprot:3237397-Pleurochrysis_carterae.AAC.1
MFEYEEPRAFCCVHGRSRCSAPRLNSIKTIRISRMINMLTWFRSIMNIVSRTMCPGYRTQNMKKAFLRCLRVQAVRSASLQSFKEGKVPLLVATDVAARGLDIPL